MQDIIRVSIGELFDSNIFWGVSVVGQFLTTINVSWAIYATAEGPYSHVFQR